jgi:hypothetical protein
MPLLGASNFLHQLVGDRSVWIKGGLGTYKTSLAYMLAYTLRTSSEFSRYGYRHIVSNIPDVWSDPLEKVEVRYKQALRSDRLQPYADTIAILDEGGLFIRYQEDVDALFSFLRKLNLLMIVPSKKEPHRTIKALRVYKKMDLHNFGLDAVLYGWLSKGDEEDLRGEFLWWGVSEIFGIFDTDYAPVDSEGIDTWMVNLKNELTGGKYEQRLQQQTQRIPVDFRPVEDRRGEDAANELSSVVEEVQAATRAISILRKRKR